MPENMNSLALPLIHRRYIDISVDATVLLRLVTGLLTHAHHHVEVHPRLSSMVSKAATLHAS